MFDLWSSELTEAETSDLVERAAAAIERRGMVGPAILALEMNKPLAGISASTAVVLSPFLVPFLGFDIVNDYSRLLKDPQNIERLLQRLERPAGPAPADLQANSWVSNT